MTQVYANILESLTSGLYNEINYAVREYLQNAYDAIKTAKKDGISEPKDGYCINVEITNDNRIITIADNGIGMEESVLKEYTSIGGGTKHDPDLTGHKGIGKLSGLRFFNKFIVKTKQYNSQIGYGLVWDSGAMMRALLGDQQGMKQIPYIDFIEEFVHFNTFSCPDYEKDHYTQIQLIDVFDEFKSQLNEMAIGSFIKSAFPVPFYEEGFKLSKHINDWLGEDLSPVHTFINDKVIYQFYRDEDRLVPPLTYIIKYDDHTRAKVWISWIKNTSETIAKSDIKGIKFRCKGICVGDNNLFANNCMPPGRDQLANWFTGEIIVLDDEIRPSAARDRFYEGEASRRFYKEIKAKVGKKLSLLADIRSEISAASQDLYKWKNNEVKSKANFLKNVEKRIRELKKHQTRKLYDFDFSIIDELSNLLEEEEVTIIERIPQEESEIKSLIKEGNKKKLLKKVLKFKAEESNTASKKAKKIIKNNIDMITEALIGEEELTAENIELETILRVIKKYLDTNSIGYEEGQLREFISNEI